MKDSDFQNLLQGVRELGQALKGRVPAGARIDRIDPDSIALIRARMKFSQVQFADALGISVNTLQNWEQGRRQPTGPARVLLRVAAKHPKAVLEAVS